jgi:putative addiction module killer protein
MATILRTAQFTEWFNTLRDRQAKARIDVRVFRLSMGNPGQHRVLQGGIAELKIDHGPGYRVYYTRRGEEIILLLIGGDKSTQQDDIELAQKLAKECQQ